MLDFDAQPLRKPPVGWKRDYLLYLDGYVKDGDRNTAGAGSTEPLPFAGMHNYPYSADESRAAPWSTAAYQNYLRKYQTRKPMKLTGVSLVEALPESGPLQGTVDPNRGIQR